MKKTLITGVIGGGAAVVIVALLLAFNGSTSQYSLSVDARTETGEGVSESHVTILNSGSGALTNVRVDYGESADTIPVIKAGEKVLLSPPVSAKTVTVTDDQGITVTKQFIELNE